ncbi:3'-5' exonuclease [Halarcobacter ebronensis]|uniref:DNA polymerase III subunit epsilon n=1 Tax=Halarcobacter ebronensis TaxID=1462615 RepID=A0A4Q1ARM4_9BACT|nr:3'-5' exonuclease [Halarcobacter ebronensis]QKF82203.1 DEDDh 3'-5' exonuclease domain family protein [Halarcobacter ebronensis]RXK03420.1 DNA polymerase III subunit epsilon [Halarcobacter ebronensis]
MPYYVLFDTETTGNQEEDRVIQFGAMVVDQKGNVEAFDEFCSTDVEIKIEAMEVHNITPNLLEGKSKANETSFFKKLEELNSPENYLIAHNISFDMAMIEKEGFVNAYQVIDTLRCAKHLFPQMPYHRLQYLRYALELYKTEEKEAAKHNITIKAHDAIGDVLVMKLFLSKLVSKCREIYPDYNPMEKLVTLTKTPVFIKTFKFGKYKNRDIAEVANEDPGYLNWMRTNLELDEDMKYSLDKVLG